MASSPRELEEILGSFQQTFEDIDPTIDITKGPMAVFIYAASEEIARTEVQVAYLQTVYRLESADELEDDDIDALGRNYGLDPDAGDVAAVVVTLYRESRPVEGEDYIAREGDLVGSNDGRFVYSLTADVVMSGETPDIYFNAEEKRYEVNVRAEAVSIGEDFNLPVGNIGTFVSDLGDFDGVTNYSEAKGGNDPLDKLQFRTLIWNTIQGVDADLVGSLVNTVFDVDPTGFTDISLVPSSELETFERLKALNGKMGYDLYALTDQIVEWLYQFTADGGETSITMDRAPVDNIQYVTVDGTPVLFNFIPDTRPTVRQSSRAQDKVALTDPLEAGQIVEVKYFYYENIWDANTALEGRVSPFGTDVLVRLGYPIPVFIAAELTVLSADDRDSVVGEIQAFSEAFLNNPDSPTSVQTTFVAMLDPREYQDGVLREVTGVAKFVVTHFNRVDRATSDIELITLDSKTEYPVLSPNFVIT